LEEKKKIIKLKKKITMNEDKKITSGAKITIGVICFFLALMVLLVINPFFTVPTGETGVVLRWGAVDRVTTEGLHWKTPVAEKVIKMDVKTQTLRFDDDGVLNKVDNAMGSMGSASKDLQQVLLAVVVNWSLVPDKTGEVWTKYGKNFESAVVQPIVRDSMKAASARFNAEELIAKRADFVALAENLLREQFEARTELAVFERVNVVDLDFSIDFNKAIEAKVTAEQNALAAKNKLEQSKYEAEQRIAQAKGEAEAIRIQAQAITQQGGKEYVNLQWIDAWKSGGAKVPQIMTGEGNGFLYNLGGL
jgi:regulator of protease activity HflC (stomatin/prohibitin superfamily)